MSKILARKSLSEQYYQLEIKPSGTFTPIQPGQYVLLRLKPAGLGISLPVIKSDASRETLTLITGSLPDELAVLRNPCASGNEVELEGPFGQAFQIENFGSVVCVADRDGLLALYPALKALHQSKNQVTVILSGEEKIEQIIEDEIRNISDELVVTGSVPGRKTVYQLERAMMNRKIDHVFVTGLPETIRDAISVCTVNKTPVQAMLCLSQKNSSKLHGFFRVNVCGNTRSLCVDGYNFNAYYPGFEELIRRFSPKPEPSVV
jgi:NAD(P)H-flavin reductase